MHGQNFRVLVLLLQAIIPYETKLLLLTLHFHTKVPHGITNTFAVVQYQSGVLVVPPKSIILLISKGPIVKLRVLSRMLLSQSDQQWKLIGGIWGVD